MHGMRFTDRLAVITGGAGGIGRAIASRLHAEGATVAIIDRDRPAAEQVAGALGTRAHPYVADILDAAQTTSAFSAITREHGHPSILINNAAYLDDFGSAPGYACREMGGWYSRNAIERLPLFAGGVTRDG